MNDTTAEPQTAPDVGRLGPRLTALLLDVPLGIYWDRTRRSAIIRDALGCLPIRSGRALFSRGLVRETASPAGVLLELTDKGRRLVATVNQDHL